MAIYYDIYDGPANNFSYTTAKKRYVCIHNTANDATAEGEASYAKRRTDNVSSHYYLDNNSIVQSLDTKHKAWHAGSNTGNTYGVSYEITGTNSKSRDWWLNNVAWDLLARQIARDMKEWEIDNRHLTISQMRDGKSTGIVTHNDMRLAWGGTDHTDPGSNFPMDHLLKKVQEYLNGEDMAYDKEAENVAWATTNRAVALLTGQPTARYYIEGELREERNWNYDMLTDLKNELEAVKTELASLKNSGTVGLTLEDIKNTVKQALREGTESTD